MGRNRFFQCRTPGWGRDGGAMLAASEVPGMKLLVSALLLAVSTAGFAQNQAVPRSLPSPPGQLVERPAVRVPGPAKAGACPLQLTAASLAPEATILPVSQWSQGDGGLNLHFRNNSGREIRSASVTAELRVKTSLYALDAKTVALHLTFSGSDNIDKALDQLAHLPLPKDVYSYGVARVTLDQVIFADGGLWTPRAGESCSVGGSGLPQRIERK